MASKHSKERPSKTNPKVTTSDTQKMIVYGYIRLTFLERKLRNKIMPIDVINIIYAFVTFRDYVTIAFIGHVDSGKSTLAANILHKCCVISDKRLDQARTTAHEIGKESFMYAFCMDIGKHERRRGISILGSSKYQCSIGTYKYAVIDVPGHRNFIKNTIRLLSMADVAILVVPINMGGFECSIQKSNSKKGYIEGSTITHARLCYVLGVDQIIVVFNKMDTLKTRNDRDDIVEIKSHQRFIECKNKLNKILKKIGFKTKKIAYIPISALYSENVKDLCVNKSYLKWYKGFKIKKKKNEFIQGFTLFDALKNVIQPNNRFFMSGVNKSFKMSVSNHYAIHKIGYILHGRVICGGIHIGQKVKPYPSSLTDTYKDKPWVVRSIQRNYVNVHRAECGEIVSINILPTKDRDTGQRRSAWNIYANTKRKQILVCHKDDIQLTKTFTALVFVMNHPGQLKAAKLEKLKCNNSGKWTKSDDCSYVYFGGYNAIIYVSTLRCECKLIRINWVNKKSNKNVFMENPEYIEQGDSAEIVFKPIRPFIVYPFHEIRSYGRIVACEGSEIVMIGKVLSVESVDNDDIKCVTRFNVMEDEKLKVNKFNRKTWLLKLKSIIEPEMIFDVFGLNNECMRVVNDRQITCCHVYRGGLQYGSSARVKYAMPIESKGNNDHNILSISWQVTHTATESFPNAVYFIGVVSNRTKDFTKSAWNGLQDCYGISGSKTKIYQGMRDQIRNACVCDLNYKKQYEKNAMVRIEYNIKKSELYFYTNKYDILLYTMPLPTNIYGVTHWFPCVSLRTIGDVCTLSNKIRVTIQ